MTVSEVIRRLHAFPQDSEVVITCPFNLELDPGESAVLGTIMCINYGVVQLIGRAVKNG